MEEKGVEYLIRLNGRLMKKKLDETMEFIRESEEKQKRIENGKTQRQGENS